ncbi:ABC transporter substrate-binding protein [Streptomyces sp. NPDC101062]|uniref:ABC transporter substrate-binding protein n=1 Tax=unclassified Streptomyces TaxID=2593676 RepID=UPI00381AA49D
MPIARLARRTALVLAAGTLLLTGCGGGGTTTAQDGASGAGADSGSASGSDSGSGSGKAAGYPRTVTNCGQKVRIDAPPEHAVSLNQGTTEILLSLGLGDRMAGTATWTDPLPKSLEKENAKVERLADNNPSFEKVLDAEPDFVASSFESTLGKGGVATRAQFEKLGVPTYVSPSDCAKDNSGDTDGSRATPLTMEDIYGEIRDLATVFDVEDRGDRLIAELKGRMSEAVAGIDTKKAKDTTFLYWFANSEAPYMGGCCGAPGIITNAVGAKNVFDSTHDEWPQINWETVADRDPAFLVIGDLSRRSETAETAAKKIEFLETNPVTKNMDAVKHQRYVRLSGQAMNPSIRTVEGVERVAAALRAYAPAA